MKTKEVELNLRNHSMNERSSASYHHHLEKV